MIFPVCLWAQAPPPQPKEVPATEIQPLKPRSKVTDYQAHANLGKVQIGAEFMRHGVPTSDGTFSLEDYVVVEVGFFGDKTRISSADFTLTVNNGKKPLPAQPFGVIMPSLKDPEWVPPEPPPAKKSSLNAGADAGGDNTPPVPPKMPMALVHTMDQKVQKAVLPEGDRTLPQGGILFFSYHGRGDKIKSVVLNYSGAAGKTTLELQP